MFARFVTGCIMFIAVVLTGAFPARADSDIERHRSCVHCGMDRKAYGYSRMLVTYSDGRQVGVCSLHCALTELKAQPDQMISAINVADRNSHALLDVSAAFWVTGGRKRGVMSATPTWAFANLDAALSFIRDYGGNIATWEQVLAIVRNEAGH